MNAEKIPKKCEPMLLRKPGSIHLYILKNIYIMENQPI